MRNRHKILLRDHQYWRSIKTCHNATQSQPYLRSAALYKDQKDLAEGLQHHKMKGKIQKNYKRRIKLVFKSGLNARNKITAINCLAVPVIFYSYGIIDWKLDEIQDLDRLTRKQFYMNGLLAEKADVHRIYPSCLEGGRSLMHLEIMEIKYKATMVGLYKFMKSKNDPQIQAVIRHT